MELKKYPDLSRKLYYKALEYAPDARAYWGLGLLAQAEGDDRKAEAILLDGVQMFPEDAILKRVLSNTLMRLGREGEARELHYKTCSQRDRTGL